MDDKLKVSKEDRVALESLMDYAEGYLPSWMRWNDIMPIAKKVMGATLESSKYLEDLNDGLTSGLCRISLSETVESCIEYAKYVLKPTS